MPLALGLALGVSFAETQFGVSAFDPLSLGWVMYYDLLTASSMWADAARTIPANVSDPVGALDDLTGNGNLLTMATGAAQPTRIASGLAFDGGDKITRVDTRIAGAAVPSTAQPLTLWAVVDLQANSASICDSGTAGTRLIVQRAAASTSLTGFAGASLTRTGTPDLATRRALLFEINGSTSSLYVNDVLQGATGAAGANALGGAVNLGGNASNLLLTGTGAGQGLGAFAIRSGLLTAQQRADLQSYAAARFGV